MPKTIRRGLIERSQTIKYTKKGGKAVASSDDVSDEQRLANNLGVSYSGRDVNLQDLIDNRLASLGISLEFSSAVTRLENAQFGETSTAESVLSDPSFSLRSEKGFQKTVTLNKLNNNNISVMSRMVSMNRGARTRTSSTPTPLPSNEFERTRILTSDTGSSESAESTAMEQAPTTGRY